MSFCIVLLIVLAVGIAGFLFIMRFDQGGFDFITPMLATMFLLVDIAVIIGLVLGKFVFGG